MTSVLCQRAERRVVISLNRPRVRNAVNRALLEELLASLDRATTDPDIDVIVLRGEGPDFCAGEDLGEISDSAVDDEVAHRIVGMYQDVTRRIMLSPKAVICAVQGWAIGAGAAWPLNADFTVWADNTRLRFPEARHGLFVSGGVSWLLERRCGPEKARELLWLGHISEGPQLITDRIAPSLTPAGSLESATHALTDRLLGLPRESLRRYKAAAAELIEADLERHLNAEAEQMLSAGRALMARGAILDKPSR